MLARNKFAQKYSETWEVRLFVLIVRSTPTSPSKAMSCLSSAETLWFLRLGFPLKPRPKLVDQDVFQTFWGPNDEEPAFAYQYGAPKIGGSRSAGRIPCFSLEFFYPNPCSGSSWLPFSRVRFKGNQKNRHFWDAAGSFLPTETPLPLQLRSWQRDAAPRLNVRRRWVFSGSLRHILRKHACRIVANSEQNPLFVSSPKIGGP